jgi:undecaprenyl-diphosphatase
MQKLVRKSLDYLNSWINFRGSPVAIASLAGCLILLIILGWLFQEVWEKEAFSFDTNVLLWIHQSANPLLDSIMVAITGLGNPPMVAATIVSTTFWLWKKRKYLQLKVFALICIGGIAFNVGLKLVFTKTRPHLWNQLIVETTFSFPSGHALGASIMYGFLAYLLATEFPRFSRLIYAAMIGLILMIGFSRLYLGVHWLTDVIAGYVIGFLWLITCISILKRNLVTRDQI